MKYELSIKKSALKKINKMDTKTRAIVLAWINKHLSDTDNPRKHGKQLKGPMKSYWRYRIGDYRVVADIRDNKLVILIVDVAHRKDIYR